MIYGYVSTLRGYFFLDPLLGHDDLHPRGGELSSHAGGYPQFLALQRSQGGDGTGQEEAIYEARTRQIGRERLFAFSQVRP